ncbi:hypothetical protein GEV33_014558 [Tenebrio molitor]|uniref:Uncharacterized protein n=1 Tax=Tenebrio molitor TaxID=7067 RepID=A0A8J6H6L6_TENMO|nr:hypothetical protein GEV33_014558 [Tenebrio molitor]
MLDGKVLLLPVQGVGNSTATMKNLSLGGSMKYEEVKKKGKTYMKFVSTKGLVKPSLIVFHFDNLFNGDKVLGDEINRVVNENWKLLYEDSEEAFAGATLKIITNVFFFALVAVVSCAKLPANFKKCNRKDPKWKDCVKEAIDDALPQLTKSFDEVNLPNFEPLWIPQVIIAGGGSVAVTQNYKNCKIFGLTKMKLDKAGTVPEYILTGEYHAGQKILAAIYEEVKKKGKTHMKFVSGKGTFKPSSIVFHFDNLFNGDKLLGDEINRVVNENWKLLFEDIEDTFLDAMTKILINILNNFFSKVSIEEAFD